MKNHLISTVLIAGSLGLTAPVIAADMGNMKDMKCMDNMKGMSCMDSHATADKISHGVGVIKEIDTKQGSVTLAHQPIEELKWPAMTMAFKVSDTKLLKGLKVGDKVNFELKGSGMSPVVTDIRPAN